jgi:hypothetical protein
MHGRRRVALIAGLSLVVASMVGTVAIALPQVMNMTTHLSTAEEIPVPVGHIERNPQGSAVLKLDNHGNLSYRLNVANIENVIMAHIHVGPPGDTGPIVVWLYPAEPPFGPTPIPGFVNGTLATGTITADDLVGPLEGGTLDDLLDEIRAGNAYFNVHTVNNPPGEIRGQIPTRGPGAHNH